MGDDLNILRNGRQPQSFGKRKTTLIFWYIEDDINVLKLAAEFNFLLGKDGLASPSLSRAWHSSAPACYYY